VNICLVTDRPRHPVLSAVMAEVAARHRVRILDTADLLSASAQVEAELGKPADVYLLRSHVPAAIALAQQLELAGALVVNRCSATAACADRVLLAAQARAARLPWPRTQTALDPKAVADAEIPLSYPVVVKSRWSRRGDLVRMIDSPDELTRVLAAWPGEPVVIQAYVQNDGMDRKLYVVDGQVLGLCSTSPLSGEARARAVIRVPSDWARLALRVGLAFGLRVYGVDLVLAAAGPVIVDINAFPGFRDVPGAREALAGLVDRLALRVEATA
jgi:ribosomal protein S6--L-glutamate ligase